MTDEHEPYMYDQITDEEWRGFRRLQAEIDRLTAQRDRLRNALESLDADFLLFAGGAPRAWYRIEQDASLGLQPGDMGDLK